MELEYVSCNYCGATSAHKVHDFSPYKIVSCSQCGLIYLNPRLTLQSLLHLYDGEYHGFQNEVGTTLAARTERRAGQVHSLDPYRGENARVLDVGCGLGFFVACARDHHWDSYGVDASEYAVEFAQRELHLKQVSVNTVETADFPEGYFDVIYMSHIIEHVQNPMGCLWKVRTWLRDGGVLVIICPDFESLDHRIERRQWQGLRIPRHFYHFTERSLGMMLRGVGYREVDFHFRLSRHIVRRVRRFPRLAGYLWQLTEDNRLFRRLSDRDMRFHAFK